MGDAIPAILVIQGEKNFFVVVKIGFLESNLAEVLNECSFNFYTYLLTQSFTSKKVFL